MSDILTAVRGRVRGYLERYVDEHRHPLNKLTHYIGIPLIVGSLPVLPFQPLVGLTMFGVGWVFQFIGHYVFEKNKPAFFYDPFYLLIGPLWVLMDILHRLGAPLPEWLSPTGAPAAA